MSRATFLTVSQVATRLSCSEHQITQMLTAGTLRGVKVGSQWRVPTTAVRALITPRSLAGAGVAPSTSIPLEGVAFPDGTRYGEMRRRLKDRDDSLKFSLTPDEGREVVARRLAGGDLAGRPLAEVAWEYGVAEETIARAIARYMGEHSAPTPDHPTSHLHPFCDGEGCMDHALPDTDPPRCRVHLEEDAFTRGRAEGFARGRDTILDAARTGDYHAALELFFTASLQVEEAKALVLEARQGVTFYPGFSPSGNGSEASHG